MSEGSQARSYDIAQILEALPHRYPLLLVDKVLDLRVDEEIHALKAVSFNEQYFQGHFPGRPIMPGVLQVEALAQASGDARFAYDSYRRFIQMYSDVVLGLETVLGDGRDRQPAVVAHVGILERARALLRRIALGVGVGIGKGDAPAGAVAVGLVHLGQQRVGSGLERVVDQGQPAERRFESALLN